MCGWSASESVYSGGSSTLGVSTHAGFLPRPNPPRLSAGRASPIPPQDLTSPVAPNGHRRGFHARRRTPCRNPFEPRGYRPGQDHSSRIPVRVTRLAIQDAFDWFDPDPHRAGNDHSDEQQAPYFQVIWTPFRNRQQPGQSRLMGRRSSLLPVVTDGTLSGVAGLRGEGTSYQSLQPTNCQLRAPCETVEFPGRIPTCAGPTTVFGPCSSTRTDCGGFETAPSTLTPVSPFWRRTRPRMVPRILGCRVHQLRPSSLLPRLGAAQFFTRQGWA